MNILAIDTTTKKAQVALKLDGKILSESIDNEITHSEKLLPLIDKVLKENNTNLMDIDIFALTVGPGSFTGVRIGIATIKAMAKVINKPIFDTTSLELYAINGVKSANKDIQYIVPLMDAKNSRVYYSIFKCIKKDNKIVLEEIGTHGNLLIDEAINNIHSQNIIDGNVLFTGDIAEKYVDNITSCFKESVYIHNSILDISSIMDIISAKKDNFEFKNYLNLDAKYFRSSEAERSKKGE